jgi:hypothetical protein
MAHLDLFESFLRELKYLRGQKKMTSNSRIKNVSRFFAKFLLSSVIALISIHVQATPARILIIRHAEKPGGADDNLSPKGYERAKALTQLFVRQPALASFGLPVSLFAFKYIPGSTSHRGVQTATPLAASLGLNLDVSFVPTENAQLAQKIMETRTFDKKTVMIVWKHSEIQALAQILGFKDAPAWSPTVFDRIWQIDYDQFGHVVSAKDLAQNLLPGDSQ